MKSSCGAPSAHASGLQHQVVAVAVVNAATKISLLKTATNSVCHPSLNDASSKAKLPLEQSDHEVTALEVQRRIMKGSILAQLCTFSRVEGEKLCRTASAAVSCR